MTPKSVCCAGDAWLVIVKTVLVLFDGHKNRLFNIVRICVTCQQECFVYKVYVDRSPALSPIQFRRH